MARTCILLTFAFLTLYFLLSSPSSPISLDNGYFRPSKPSSATKPPLRVDPAGTFTIAIFADLHYGEEEHGWGISQDIKSTRVMQAILESESPDLVVINGDFITGENTFRENSTGYVHQIVAPLVERHLPWASTYGNHDSKFNLSREALFLAESAYSLSYTMRMDPGLPGITNYYLLVHNSTSKRNLGPVAVLWFFDSRGGASYQHEPANEDDIPNWVHRDTARWFRTSQEALRAEYGLLPSLVFVHIPPRVFLDAQDKALDPSHFPGVNDDIPVAIEGEGTEDSDFVQALLSTEGLHSIYVGHDHGNAWCSTWPQKTDAPFLCFSKHSAYGGYGTWNRGVRVVQLSFASGNTAFGVDTWVRMENGDVISRVSLNETYGVDTYPTADGEDP
jgi:hypothetical protein